MPDEVKKNPKGITGYRMVEILERRCGTCVFFQADEGECDIVAGDIEADAVCDLFSPARPSLAVSPWWFAGGHLTPASQSLLPPLDLPTRLRRDLGELPRIDAIPDNYEVIDSYLSSRDGRLAVRDDPQTPRFWPKVCKDLGVEHVDPEFVTEPGATLADLVYNPSTDSYMWATVEKMIRQEDGRWCVYSADGSRRFGCYDTEAAAQRRLAQIEHFSNATDYEDDDEEDKKKEIETSLAVTKALDEQRYTFGPLYVPDALDAHGDFTTASTLQRAAWDYVRRSVLQGSNRIYRQHTNIPAGEWVEMATWPFEHEVEVTLPNGNGEIETTKRKFPAGTVYQGIVWDESTWPDVKAGRIRGLSLGGRARVREAHTR